MKAIKSGVGTNCEARQYSDGMHCYRCGYVYDVNDPDPPECIPFSGAGERTEEITEQVPLWGSD